MQLILVIMGLIPFAFGYFMNWLIMTYQDSITLFNLVSILYLVLWGTIAYFAKSYIKSVKKIVIGQNLAAFIVLLLIGIQELILHQYWLNFVGISTQYFYLPLIRFGYLFTNWSNSIFIWYCAAFVMMVMVSILGCKLRRNKY